MFAKLWSVILLLLLTTLNISCSNRGSSNGDVANSTYGLKLKILDGDNQKTMPGRLFIKPLTVQATNIVGEPVADLTIDFSITSGSGFYLTPSTVKTGPSGIAAIEVKGPDAYNAIGQILAKIEGTPITQVFSIATNDSVPGVHFEIESTLGTKITAGKEFGFIVKLVNADGSIVNYTGPMETIWNMSAGNSWGGFAPKNLLTSYSCAFVAGVCYTPASGPQAIVLYDSRTPTTVFMGDGNSGYMDVFAYDITVVPDVPAKVAIANGKGGPNAGAKVIDELVLTADDSPMNFASAVTDASGNYLADGGSVSWTSDRVELSSYFSSNTGDTITFTPTKTIAAGNFGYVYAQHPSYPLASSGKVYIDPGLLERFKIEKVGGGTTVTAGEPFQILIRAVDAKGNSIGQNSKGSGFHGTRILQITTTNYQSGSRPTGGEVPWFGLTSNLDDDGNGKMLPGWPRVSIVNNSSFPTFFNLGETTALANDYQMILFDATNTAPTLTVSTGALTPYPAITGSITFNVVAGPPHHLMLRQGAGPEAQSYCELPTTLAGPAASYNLKTMVLEPFAITPNPAKTETCFRYGTMTFTSGQTVPNIYYAIEDIAGNWIANVSGSFSTSYGFDSANSNSFRNRLSPSTGLSQSLTLTGTLAGLGGIEISADYTSPSSGAAVTYRSYLIGTVIPSDFHHFDIEIGQSTVVGEPAKPVLPNIWSDREFTLSLVSYDAANNQLNGNIAQGTDGTALMTVTPTGSLLSSPDGTEPIDIPDTSIITMGPIRPNSPAIYERRMWIPNIATGGVTFSITGATNGAPDRSITLNPIAGPLTSIDIRTASGSAGSSIIGQQVNLTTDDNTTYYISGFDKLGNFASMPVGTWSVENLSLADSLTFTPTGNTSLFQPAKPGTADKIKVVYNNGGTVLTVESGPVVLTSGMFHHISVNVPDGTKTAGEPFNVTLKLKDQKGNTLSNLNGPQSLTINVVGSTTTLLGYSPSVPLNGNYVFVNGETTLPFTFYNSSDTNPQIQVNATIGGNYGGGTSQNGDIVVANSALHHLHLITTDQTISAGSTNQFNIYAEDEWGNQMKSGTGSNLQVQVNLTNSSLTSQDITATTLTSASSVATANDTSVDGYLTVGTANFTVTSNTAGVMTLSASVLSGGTLPGSNIMDSLTILPLTQVSGIRWAPSQDPLAVHSASPTNPISSSTGSLAAQILDQYQNVITTNNSETINIAVVGGTRSFYSGTTARTVADGTATFGDLKYTKAENITLRASVGSNSSLFTDASVSVSANGSKQTVVVMPNQIFTEGTGLEGTAITGTPFAAGSDVNAGNTFQVTVRLVDIAFNTVLETGTQISLVSTDGLTDPNITVSPATGTFVNGQETFNITVKRRGTHRLVATPIATQIGKLPATPYTVQPLSTQTLVVLLPGQTLNEGAPDLATAITGPSPTQTAGVQFNARVIATDTFFNQTPSEPGTSVSITTSDPNDTHPGSQILTGSETTFPVTNVTALNNQTISATGSYAGSSSKLYAINPNTATKCILSYGAPQVYTPGKTPYSNALTGQPSNKTAGNSFNVTAYAVDDYFNVATNYSGSVQVTTPNDDTDTEPGPSTFSVGTKLFTIDPVSAGINKAIQLTCTGLSAQTPAIYNIDVGAKTYLVSYFPAFQSFDSTRGHQSLTTALNTQSSANRNAGTQYTVNVVATDSRYNIVNDTTTVTLASSDANSTADAPKALVAGQSSFNLTNYRAGNSYTVGATGAGFTKQDSTPYNVISGSASKLLVVLPGENFSQGRELASEAAADSPNKQTVDFNYQIKVYATDSYFNQITSENTAMVSLTPSAGSLNYVSLSSIQMASGLATFTVNHSAALGSLTISPSATGYAGETSDPYEVIATLSTPTLSLQDGTTNSISYVRQVLATATITEGATVNAWCLSEAQSTRPVTAGTSNNKTTCSGPTSGARDALNWYTSQPSNITFGATNELKTVYLWVADAANNVSVTPVYFGITLDTVLPATPTLAFPSGTHTNISTPALTVTGDTDAYKYCLIEQDGGLGAPIPPLYGDVCWSSTRPTTATMGAPGNRKVYLFTKDIAENVSTAGGNYFQSIFYDPDAPDAFTVTGIKGNTDSVADTHLGTTLIPTVVWSTASDASTVTYNVVIKESDIELGGNCSQSISGATTLTMTGCNLVDGQNYTVEISATDQALNVTNSGSFAFDVDNSAPAAFAINGATGGSDVTADGLLNNGNIVTANWNDTTGETGYKVAVYRSDQTTVQCNEVTKSADVISHTFTGCSLSYANTYYLSVKALDDSGNVTAATNSKFAFTVVPQATTYLVTLTSGGDQYAGSSVDLTITAKLPNTTTDTTFTGVQTVSFNSDGGAGDNSICNLGSNVSFEAPTSVTFSNGVGLATGVKLKKAESGRTVTASSTIGGVSLTGTTSPFNVLANAEACKRFLDSNLSNGTVLSGTTVNLSLGQTQTVYSIGYDTYGNFIGESPITWTGTSNIISVPNPRIGTSTTVTGVESGSGFLQGSGSPAPAQITFNVSAGTSTWTSASTDVNGKNYLGSSNIIKAIFYDATSDSRQAAGTNWRQGSTTKSWYTESLSAVRGSRDEFPAKTFIIGTDLGLDIVDATTNQLWMRFIAGSGRAINSDFGIITDIKALEGKLYISMAHSSGAGGLIIIDFVTDEVFQINNAAKKSTQTILNRNSSGTLNVNATYPNLSVNEKVFALSALKISSNEYLALGTLTRALLMKTNSTVSLYASSSTTGQPITSIQLTSTSKLYFAESSVKLHRANLTLPLSGNFADSYGYDKSTNAKLANLEVTSLSIAEKVFSGTYHQLLVGSASGLTVINENATDTSATSTNYNYQGSGTLNPSTGTNPFGTGIVQSLGDSSSYLEAAHNSGLTNTGTIDLWFRPEVDLSSASAIMSLVSKGSTAIDGSFGILFNAGGQGKLELWVRHGGFTYIVESTTTTWSKGRWYHLAGVFKPASLDLYVDGFRENQSTPDLTGFAVNTSTLRIAGNGTNGFTGAIDDLQISKTDRYSSVASFTVPNTAYSTDPTNNVYLFLFDQNSGLTATATNGTNATLTGNCWLSKPLYKGSDTAINALHADSVTNSTSTTELITNSAWTELTNLQTTASTNASDTNLPGTGVFYYHRDAILTKDIGIIKINGAEKELYLKVR